MISNVLKIREPNFYYRDIKKDLPEKIKNLPLRVFSATLPILSFFKSNVRVFRYYLPFLRASKNIWNTVTFFHERKYYKLSKNLLNTSLSIASLVGNIFANPFGLFISTFHDIGLNSCDCIKLLSKNKYYTNTELLKQVMNIASSSLYLIAFYGCLEIQVASLGILLITELISSVDEYNKGDYIQLTSHLIMTIARSYQLIPQVKNLNKKLFFEREMKTYFSHLNCI